jgi:hypothetical protein
LVAGQGVIGHRAGLAVLGPVDDRHRHVLLGADLGRRGVVAAAMRDDEARAVVRELAQLRMHVAVAYPGVGQEFHAVLGGDGLGGVEALLVPAVVGRLLGHHDGERLEVRGAGAEGGERAGAQPHQGRGEFPGGHACSALRTATSFAARRRCSSAVLSGV